jgi:hypothetical protein
LAVVTCRAAWQLVGHPPAAPGPLRCHALCVGQPGMRVRLPYCR